MKTQIRQPKATLQSPLQEARSKITAKLKREIKIQHLSNDKVNSKESRKMGVAGTCRTGHYLTPTVTEKDSINNLHGGSIASGDWLIGLEGCIYANGKERCSQG